MLGASPSQGLWGTYNGSLGVYTLSELMSAYKNIPNRLPEYQIYVFQGPGVECRLITPGAVYALGNADMMKVTGKSGGTVILPSSGLMYDIAEWDPVHLTMNHPGNAKYFVGYYGRKQPEIDRRIASYEFVGPGAVYCLDLPNFLTSAYAAVISEPPIGGV